MKKTLSFILICALLLSMSGLPTFAENSKMNYELQYVLKTKAPDELIIISVWTNLENPNATEMPSWPDIRQARKELKEFYTNQYYNEIVPVVFNGIEYEELCSIGYGLIIVSVKAGDVEKIASCDIVKDIDFFEFGPDINFDKEPYLFELEYREQYEVIGHYNYSELYYHYDENEALDWVLVNAQSGLEPLDMEISMDIGNVVVQSCSIFHNFRYQYGVYDVSESKFYDLFDLRSEPEKYDGLLDVLVQKKIGQLIGDLDNDGVISILDATKIQLCLAGLESFPNNEFYSVYNTSERGRMSDFDKDGDVSILDATAIQLNLAQIN